MHDNFQIPVTIIIYNRPTKLRLLINTLRNIKPKNIYVISDGPKDNTEDQHLVNECRDIIRDIDWEHNIHTNYSEFNLGLRKRVETGLDWVFGNVEYSIILEDDCIPNKSFFEYMEYYLKTFKDTCKVYMVTGNNLYTSVCKNMNDDVFFTHSALIWGWGTWARSWEKYKMNRSIWSDKSKRLKLFFQVFKINYSIGNVINSYRFLSRIHNGNLSSWAFLWSTIVIYNKGYVITPKYNLVKNIGFDSKGTHTVNPHDERKSLTNDEISFVFKDNLNYSKDFGKRFIDDVFGRPKYFHYIFKLLSGRAR